MPEALTRHQKRAGALPLRSCSLETLTIWVCRFVWKLRNPMGPWGCLRRILYNDIHCLYTRSHGQRACTGFRTFDPRDNWATNNNYYTCVGMQVQIFPDLQK